MFPYIKEIIGCWFKMFISTT